MTLPRYDTHTESRYILHVEQDDCRNASFKLSAKIPYDFAWMDNLYVNLVSIFVEFVCLPFRFTLLILMNISVCRGNVIWSVLFAYIYWCSLNLEHCVEWSFFLQKKKKINEEKRFRIQFKVLINMPMEDTKSSPFYDLNGIRRSIFMFQGEFIKWLINPHWKVSANSFHFNFR